MDFHVADLRRFLYSHYFFNGVRQALGMLLPVAILGGIFHEYHLGLVATFGAQCLAIIDQPGSPRRHRLNELLCGAALGTLTTAITGLASTYPLLLFVAVVGQCFVVSMLSVFGRRGILVGFGTLLLMALTMHTPLQPHEVWVHTLATLGGAVFYFVFSLLMSRMLALGEERKALAVALFATADYMATRASFYDEDTDLDEVYQRLIRSQAGVTETHQAARDHILRALPRGVPVGQASDYVERERIALWNTFMDMLRLIDILVATHTDYAVLRRGLAGHDVLVFMRDALRKLSRGVSDIAQDISAQHPSKYRNSAKAELRAIEYEIDQLRNNTKAPPAQELIVLMVQVLRRLRNAASVVDRMAANTRVRADLRPTDELRIDKSLSRFMSRPTLRFSVITSNLRLSSPYCRHAMRVALAAGLAMLITGSQYGDSHLGEHSYWVLVTIAVVMRPGFAMSRQRNLFRLLGTLIGCVLAPLLFMATDEPAPYFVVMMLSCLAWMSLLQVNYLLSSLFNTVYVVLVFHFVDPASLSLNVAGERALDTLLGCALALVCSYVLPWWEARHIRPLAHATVRANRAYLASGLDYVRASRAAVDQADKQDEADEAKLAWRLARHGMHTAFGNFSAAFTRMMREPRQHQVHVPEFNTLMIQNHILTSQIASVIPTLAEMKDTPQGVQQVLQEMLLILDESQPDPPSPVVQLDVEGDAANLIYPMKQMANACALIRKELAAL